MDPIIFRPIEFKLITKPVPYSIRISLLSYSVYYYLLSLVLTSVTVSTLIECEHDFISNNGPTTPLHDFYLEKYHDIVDPSNQNGRQDNALPTPSMHSSRERPRKNLARHQDSGRIKPARVYRFSDQYNNDDLLFSPIFSLRSMETLPRYINSQSEFLNLYQNDAPSTDTPNYSDLIDSGSGNFENPSTQEESTNLLDESIVHSEYDQNSNTIASAPTQAQTHLSYSPSPDISDEGNQAPYLNRRLPRLAVTAGQVWKYFVPPDTFTDEDGDMRQLRSAIVRKNIGNFSHDKLTNMSSLPADSAQYHSWVQYDANSQLLYGLPTESDVGKHELSLIVGDRLGATSQETIEIYVRQHQSSRAFTHQFLISNIIWEPEKFPSMVDVLGELIKQVSTRVFMDRAFENFIVRYYTLDFRANSSSGQDNRRASFNLAWSNSSIPIHPCSIGQIENLFRSMVNTQFLRPDWSSDISASSKLPPSMSMLRVLEPDFRPESVSINLMGSCDSREMFKNNSIMEHDNNDSRPKVGAKIGRLSWLLGQPIEYRIPVETFNSDRGAYTTRDLQLSLHTIDGLPLDKDPKYNFIDFDSETQVIFGLPFSQEDHSGERELQITARHPKSGYKVREVFIINIGLQDLTTINNRAFQMSVYFHARTRTFGPQERISLSHKIVAATGEDKPGSLESGGLQQITVINISKNINRAQLIPSMQGSFDGEFADITRSETKTDPIIDLKEADPVYKLTWTNQSIGFQGDCPVEVIKENILYSLEQSMLEFKAPIAGRITEDRSKNDSTRFFERLRQYFEPELDLVHLRFEPLGACLTVMELHDVGNSDMADMIDRANELNIEPNLQLKPPSVSQAPIPTAGNDSANEEYWSIVVLLVLVVTLIFVIIMFFMGMHTYKINQDKRFEMQVKLAQARQNSMYLSSMILANLATPNDCGSALAPIENRTMCIVHDEDKGSRKPVILDNEKRLFNGTPTTVNGPRSLTVHLDGTSAKSSPFKQNSMVTLDSMTSIGWQPSMMGLSMSPSALLYTPIDGKQRSMTLNRRSGAQRPIQLPPEVLNHSLTVASLAGSQPIISQANIPLVYTPVLPVVNGSNSANNYGSLQRFHQSPGRQMNVTPARIVVTNQPTEGQQQFNQILLAQQQNQSLAMDYSNQETKLKSSSRSSSASATTNSVISNPNYSLNR